MSDDEMVAAIEARLAAATPGDWEGYEGFGEFTWFGMSAADAALVRNAPTDLAYLLAEVKRSRSSPDN